ncbi:MAG: UDP-N-acetylmuramoyl-L-alanine--D-glutamate ligase [Sterolibacteriaceae bacterium]|nr:UDP-N-acetylmuramoyl-L-alanine--D-glutamate ligase [Sterolibacteriaceae bacterium]MBK9087461.1 UDP-N-acetylmuramoyl-L-alanine--D-glutamate ligase [Sterolibacteriaceae bacterium]
MRLNGKHVLVLGLGESGLAMARWLAHAGAIVRVADSRAEPPGAQDLVEHVPQAEMRFGAFDLALLSGIDLIAISPGLSQSEPLVQEAKRRGIAMTGEIELFARGLRDLGERERCRIIAITGTNGKTTVTTLCGAMARAAGVKTEVAGNISPAALARLRDCAERKQFPGLWVLELSSFQLETTETLDAEAATVLNLTDDHLDRYQDLDGYAAAKARIFAGSGVQVLNRQDSRVAAMALTGRRVVSFGLDQPTPGNFGLVPAESGPWLAQGTTPLLAVSALPLAGLHNAANALAALALCEAVGLPRPPMLAALGGFRGLAHRVEKVADWRGIAFYDDSKGTNVGATVAALQGLRRKVVLIAGGDGKGQDFSPLGDAVAQYARAVVLIGRDGQRIADALAGRGVPQAFAADMDEAVRRSVELARPGDAVLLSPACASFDMFRGYAHRAEVFVAAVQSLIAREGRAA